jgi:ketosteroid isomerase-like protein
MHPRPRFQYQTRLHLAEDVPLNHLPFSRTGQLEGSADFREQGAKVRSCRVTGASAIHARRMNELTKDALREIEQIHSNWIKYEVAGDNHRLMALCADDIELWPPDAQPLLGRAAVAAQMARGMTKLHSIEITDLRIRGSNEIAYLTASYRTTFSPAEDSTCRQALGSHLWMLRKRTGTWVANDGQEARPYRSEVARSQQ